MSPGIVILLIAVVGAVGFGLHRRRVDGRFGDAVETGASPSDPDRRVETGVPAAAWTSVAAALPDAVPGEHATLVQFSSAFCAPCRTTRVVLADVADAYEGVAHVEVDAEQHLELVRELDIRRTPTTLVLDAAGREITRAAGAPRREQVLGALPAPQESPR